MTEPPVQFLVGKHLYLRPYEESDLVRIRRWRNDPDIRRFLLSMWPLDSIGEKQWFENLDRKRPLNDIFLAIVISLTNEHIGNIGLHRIDWRNRSAVTGMVVGRKDCQRKGVGFEAKELLLEYAFNTLGLHRITSHVHATNIASLRCLAKSGYKEEGRMRQALFLDGAWHDEVILGILADEWRALRTGRKMQ